MTNQTKNAIDNILNSINHNKFTESEIIGISFSTFKKYINVERKIETIEKKIVLSPAEIISLLNEYGRLDGWCELEQEEGTYSYEDGQFIYSYNEYKTYYKIIE